MIADYLDRGNPNSPPNVCISSANAVGSFITIFLNGYQIVLRVEEACQS